MKNKTETFIEKAVKRHGDKYDYSMVDYKHCMQKVKIICRKHGVFEQSPNGHLTTNGCYACGKENSSLLQRSNKTAFVEKAQKVHNFEFDYSLVDYKNSDTKVDIICKKHGVFSQRPNKHLVGDGCPDCKFEKIASIKRFTKEQFVQKAKETHGDLYDYSKVNYKNSITNVEIICKEHGSFWQKPNNHIFDRGCPSCAKTGYRPIESGYLYLMAVDNIIKIGITNLTPAHRSKDISRSYGKKFEVINEWKFENGFIPNDVETTVLRYLRSKYKGVDNKFEGSSECFLNVDLEDLKIKIEEEIIKW